MTEPSKPSILTLIAEGISEGLHPDERMAFFDALPSDEPPVQYLFLAEAIRAGNPGHENAQAKVDSTLDFMNGPTRNGPWCNDPGILLCALALRIAEAEPNYRNFIYALYLFNALGRFKPSNGPAYRCETTEKLRSRSGDIPPEAYRKACLRQRDILLRLVRDA